MTVGELLASLKSMLKEFIDSLPIKEYIDKAIETIAAMPGKMAHSFNEIITNNQWAWLLTFVCCVIAVAFFWKASAKALEILTKWLLFIACIVLALAAGWCVLNGRFDIAIILLLLALIVIIKQIMFPPPPSPPPPAK